MEDLNMVFLPSRSALALLVRIVDIRRIVRRFEQLPHCW